MAANTVLPSMFGKACRTVSRAMPEYDPALFNVNASLQGVVSFYTCGGGIGEFACSMQWVACQQVHEQS